MSFTGPTISNALARFPAICGLDICGVSRCGFTRKRTTGLAELNPLPTPTYIWRRAYTPAAGALPPGGWNTDGTGEDILNPALWTASVR